MAETRTTGNDKRKFGFWITDNEVWDCQLTPIEFSVYSRILFRANHNRNFSFESIDNIAKACRCGRSSVKRALTVLEEKKLLVRELRFKENGGQQSTVWHMNDKSRWVHGGPSPAHSEPPPSSEITTPPVHTEPPPQSRVNPKQYSYEQDPIEQDSEITIPAKAAEPSGRQQAPSFSDPEVLDLAQDWCSWAKDQHPWQSSYEPKRFADALLKIKTKAKIETEPLRHLLEFIKTDDFWCKNAVSPVSLLRRSKNTDEFKWEMVLRAMATSKRYKSKMVSKRLEEVGAKPLW